MLGGYAGKILFVDLSKGTIKEKKLSPKIYRDFIGGNGLGIRVCYEQIKPKSDPLGPDNVLGFVTGPLTATATSGSGRFTVVAKSPLTGTWAEANSGGFFGPELKEAGYDAIFFSGISPKPVYFVTSGGKAELKDASYLWGKDTYDTDDLIHKELGDAEYKIACIGPASESLSLISGIVNEKGRIAARSGVGAVMGSKRLKAVAVKGSQKITVADPEKHKSVRQIWMDRIKSCGFEQGLTGAGTGGGTSFLVSIGDTPIKNWGLGGTEAMPSAKNLDSANMDKYKVSSYGCHACPVRCGAIIKLKEGPFAIPGEMHRPEYETLASLGTMLLNDNLEAVIKANDICNRSGLDTMAAGSAIAFAMECYENGLITKNDTGGIELTWGNAKAIVAITEQMAKRQGFGDVLADGVEKAAKKIGKGSEKYAMHVHGQSLPYHDPRNTPSLGTGYFADANPAHHMDNQVTGALEQGAPLGADPVLQTPKLEMYGDYQAKGPMYSTGVNFYQLTTSAGFCTLYTIANTIPVAEFIAAVTGWDFDWEEGIKAGQRIATLRQAFNAREGLAPAEFGLPERVKAPAMAGIAKGVKVDFDSLRNNYYAAQGWDPKSGRPYMKTLVSLGLDKLAGDVWSVNPESYRNY